MIEFRVVQTLALSLLLGLGATMAVQAAERVTAAPRSIGNTSPRFGINPPKAGSKHGFDREEKICFIESCKKPGGKPNQPVHTLPAKVDPIFRAN